MTTAPAPTSAPAPIVTPHMMMAPLLVWTLQRFGLYPYGVERSFSRRALRRMLADAGFEVVAETGILFLPGWLRMIDLACHCWYPRLASATRALVAPFAFLDRRVSWLRRHGYLLASVAVKPQGDSGDRDTRGAYSRLASVRFIDNCGLVLAFLPT